ncbi:MAG: glycosyltransferase family 2 protein [Deltaproteobacteria bacterium]|nr:glycosyltransferase family 2 protein [Deltaproteobacteria bacterium]
MSDPTMTRDLPPFAVIIPAWNEAPTVAAVVRTALDQGAAEVVVVDDASTDQTIEEALQAGATVLPLRINLGAWGATQAGFRHALKAGYSLALSMDADGQHRAEDMAQVLDPVAKGTAEVCIGSCPQRGSRLRHLAWTIFRAVTGLGVADLTSGFRAYSQRAMSLLLHPMAHNFHHQDMGALLMLSRFGLRVVEAPVTMELRACGKSRVFSSWFVVALYMTTTLLLCCSKRGQAVNVQFLEEPRP